MTTRVLHLRQAACSVRYCLAISHVWVEGGQTHIQHGDNPEHRHTIDATPPLNADAVDWYAAIHDREGLTREAARARMEQGEPLPEGTGQSHSDLDEWREYLGLTTAPDSAIM